MDLDSWIQSKLTMADDYLTTVKKYLTFEEEAPTKELPLVPQLSGEPEMMGEPEAEIEVIAAEEPSADDLAALSQPEADLDDAEAEASAEDVIDQFAEDDVPDGESMADPEINEAYIMPRLG